MVGYILKNVQKAKCVRFHEIIGSIIMKIKMKNRSHRYDIIRPRAGHRHKYNKY